MNRIILNIFIAGMFMNFIYPEIQFQVNKIRFNGSLVEQFNQIDINDLIINSEKYLDNMGNFNKNLIQKKYKEYKEPPKKKNMPTDELLSSV